jgi:Nucleotide modification associated domain 2
MNVKPGTKFWLYKQTNDSGFAPCIEADPTTGKPLLTLATCKQDIRMGAQLGEVVIGLSENDGGNRLTYVAGITGVIERGDYYRRPEYKSRFDNIYDDSNGQAIWNGKARQDLSPEHLKEDVGEDFRWGRVLLSDSNSFHYPGADGKRVFGNELLEYLNPRSRGTVRLHPRGNLYEEVWKMVASIQVRILSPRHRHSKAGCPPRPLPLLVEVTLTLP